MPSIALSRLLGLLALSLAALTGSAQNAAPSALYEPVFGLRYELAMTHFDTLPDDEIRKCPTLADDERMRSRTWVYAAARDEGRRYYVIGGYSIRSAPKPPNFPKYELNRYGTVIEIDGDACIVFGPAREVFDARLFDEIPQPVLAALADNLSATLAQAFGGRGRLQREFRRQNIPMMKLSPELGKAFAADK